VVTEVFNTCYNVVDVVTLKRIGLSFSGWCRASRSLPSSRLKESKVRQQITVIDLILKSEVRLNFGTWV
jgi:hypothetical protein